jgi:hypothetical protein
MRTPIKLAVVAVLFALSTGCSNTRPDASITTDIQSKLFASPTAKSATLEVSTSNGEVTLSGQVPSDAARYEAFKLATETEGVTRVHDQMTIAQAQPATESAPAEPIEAPKPAAAPAPQRAPRREVAATPRPAANPEPAPMPAPVAAPAPTPVAAVPAPPPPPPQPVMRTVEIPAGTAVRAQMRDSVDSAVNKAGESFRASLAAPIVVNNEVVVPAGADLTLQLMDASSAGRMRGRSEIHLQLVGMDFQGQSYQLTSNDYSQQSAAQGGRTAATIGGASAIGALIGAAVGGGKGAAIGAGAGAGAGTVASAATKGPQVQVPSETMLDFTLQQPVSVTYNPEKNRTTR